MVRLSIVVELVKRAECVNNRLKKDIAHQGRVDTIRGRAAAGAAARAKRRRDWMAPPPPPPPAIDLSDLAGTLLKLDQGGGKSVEALFVYAGLLRECVQRRWVEQAEMVYRQMAKHGYTAATDRFVGHLLIELYGHDSVDRGGRVEAAERVFDTIVDKTANSYKLMITAYTENGHPDKALDLFRRMPVLPCAELFVAAMNACSRLKNLSEGRRIHKQAVGAGLYRDPAVQEALLRMYIELDDLNTAKSIFRSMKTRTSSAWNALICGYISVGWKDDGFKLFRQMLAEPESSDGPIVPSSRTLKTIFQACTCSQELAEMQDRIKASGVRSGAFRVAMVEAGKSEPRSPDLRHFSDRLEISY